MAKAAYIGVDSVAQKVKKIYIGVDGVARKVKKAYIGVDCVARLFYQSKLNLKRYGTATGLSAACYSPGAATIGNYALIAGGQTGTSTFSSNVNAYNKSLTKSSATALSAARSEMGAASVGDHALFAGGYIYSKKSSAVDAYDSALTRLDATALAQSRAHLQGVNVGNYALFVGGDTPSGTRGCKDVEAFDKSLTKTTPTELSTGRQSFAAARVGDYAIVAGGYTYSTITPTAEAYDASLTKVASVSEISQAKQNLAGATAGSHALFAGGIYQQSESGSAWSYSSDTVDAYDKSLTRTAIPALSAKLSYLAGATLDEYAIFAGGTTTVRSSTSTVSNVVNSYDASLTRTVQSALAVARNNLAGVTIGNYALLAGGRNDSSFYNTVDVYEAS